MENKIKYYKLGFSFLCLIVVFGVFTIGAFVGQSITLQEYDCRNPLAFQFHEYELRQCQSELQNITIQYEVQKYLNDDNYNRIMLYSEFYNQYSDIVINLSDKYFFEKEKTLDCEFKLALCEVGVK